MSEYGLIIKDADGSTVKLTSDIANIIDVDNYIMPNTLIDTDKYYVDADLPGNDAIAIDNIACIINAFRMSINIHAVVVNISGEYSLNTFLDDSVSNYTKNLSTGVMTFFAPGECIEYGVVGDWDIICTIYPETYWDKFSDTTVTKVKMFSAMRYYCFDGSASTFIDAYELGENGVNQIDYIISMRRKVV